MNLSRHVLMASFLYVLAAHGDTADSARGILTAAGVHGGLLVHLGCGDGRLTAALGRDEQMLVQGLDADPGNVASARRNIRALGAYGRVSVEMLEADTLPYIDNLVNVLVVSADCGVRREELLRVLVPGGVLFTDPAGSADRGLRKPWPAELDEWGHWLHGPNNNAVSRDKRVGISRNMQWIMPPRWARHHNLLPSVSAMVSAGGRLYTIIDEAPISVRGPDRWSLVARDAFNGLLLWKRPISDWGWKQWSDIEVSGLMRFKAPSQVFRRLVAAGDRVYVTLGFRAPVAALDGATGEMVREYDGTEDTAEMLYLDGNLLLVRNADGGKRKRAMSIRADTGRVLWESQQYGGTSGHGDELSKYTDAYLTAGNGRAFLIDGSDVVGLDLATGGQLWRTPRPDMPTDVLGHYQFNHANLCTLVLHGDTLLLGQMLPFKDNLNKRQQKEMVVRAMDAATGKTRWEHKGMSLAHFTPPDLFVVDGLVWTLRDKDVCLIGLDVATGEVRKQYPVKNMLIGHHHRCYRNKATENLYLAGEEGIEYIDFRTGALDVHHWLRGACSYGLLPANGLIYLPAHSCGCHHNVKLNGFIALSAGGTPELAGSPGNRLRRGPAVAVAASATPAPPDDWPVYRGDSRRSGFSTTALPESLTRMWSASPGSDLTPPVIAAGNVFVASKDSFQLSCLNAADGSLKWQVTTAGGIDSAPSYHDGLLVFGTSAGYVCALNAEDGRLIWRFRAAPAEVRMSAFGRLESPWPVHGSVLVESGKVTCVAGRSMHLNSGLYAFVLNVKTGEVLHERRLVADTESKGELQGAVLPDILVSDGETIGMRTMRLNLDLTAYTGKHGRLLAANDGGLLDDTWFNSAFWTYGGAGGQMLVFDDETAYGLRAFKKLVTKSYSHDVFTPGQGYSAFSVSVGAGTSGGGKQKSKGNKGSRANWEKRIPIRAEAIVATDRHLCLAGTPDTMDGKAPWGAFDGREGAVLLVLSKGDGEMVATHDLDSVPVYDGMAAAGGRLYISTRDGRVVCYGGDLGGVGSGDRD